jgi:hypothetical protein
MHEVMRKKLVVLLVAHSCVDKDEAIAFFNQHASHSPRTHIILVGRIKWMPHRLGNYAKHGATIEFEVPRIDN